MFGKYEYKGVYESFTNESTVNFKLLYSYPLHKKDKMYSKDDIFIGFCLQTKMFGKYKDNKKDFEYLYPSKNGLSLKGKDFFIGYILLSFEKFVENACCTGYVWDYKNKIFYLKNKLLQK